MNSSNSFLSPNLDSVGILTDQQLKILKMQIKRNSFTMDRLISAIDLLTNKEGCPNDANILSDLQAYCGFLQTHQN